MTITAATPPTPVPPPAPIPTIAPLNQSGPPPMVEARNVGATDFKGTFGHFNNQPVPFTIPAGTSMYITWDMCVKWFGNPAVKNVGKHRDREREVQRLRALYGAYEYGDVWETNRPRIEIHLLDGTKLTTVIDDPDGDTVHTATQSQAQQTGLEQQVAQLQQQLGALQSAMVNGGVPQGGTVPPIPTPGPAPIPPPPPPPDAIQSVSQLEAMAQAVPTRNPSGQFPTTIGDDDVVEDTPNRIPVEE